MVSKSVIALLAVLMLAGSAMAALTIKDGSLHEEGKEAMEKKRGSHLAPLLTPGKGFTQMMHEHMEKKHVEKLARLGRKDTRRAVIPTPEVGGGDDGAAAAARRGWSDNGVARPNFMELGEEGCSDVLNTCQYGLSCQNNVCVGPAKAGESCTAAASGFMCETGSFCRCTDISRDSCTCIEEKKEGSCEYQIECTGGYLCNWDYETSDPTVGTCMAMGSVPDGGIATDDVLCEYGLFYDDTTSPDNSVCTSTPNTCTVDAQCALTYSTQAGFFTTFHSDGIYYSCSNGNCVSANPNCKAGFSNFASLSKKEHSNNYGAPNAVDYSAAGYKLQKCLYDDHVTDELKGFPYSRNGNPSSGNFPFFNSGAWSDSTWVSEGGDCSSVDARCEVGLSCINDVCYFWNEEGESCAGDNNRCEPGSFCYNGTTCWPSLKGGEECHYESDSLYGYTASTQCMLGYGCNFDSDTSAGSKTRWDGICTEFGTLETAQAHSDTDFCAYGLRSVDEGGDFPVCRGFVDETCNSFGDCDIFNSNYDAIRDYDYDYYFPDIPAGKWDYGFYKTLAYLEGQLFYCASNVTGSDCMLNDEMDCTKVFHKYLTYLKGKDKAEPQPNGDAERCALSQCIYDAVTYSKFTTCNSAAGLLPAPVLMLLAVALAVFLH